MVSGFFVLLGYQCAMKIERLLMIVSYYITNNIFAMGTELSLGDN